MKRLLCLLFALVLLCGVMVLSVSAEETEDTAGDGSFTTSDDCIAMITQMEGFVRYPMWDYAQWTVGYGTRCPDDMLAYYSANGITEAQAENLLRNFLDRFETEINEKLIKKHNLKLNQHQFDALVSFSYNCGTAWIYSSTGTFYKAIVEGYTGNDLVRAFALWCSAGDEVQLFLIRRRLSEANMYLNGVYSQTPPKHYCYVLYNANGGTTSPRTQGYSTEWTATPYPVPTYEGYTFTGWYTQRTGGTKVTSLDATHNGTTLYAHWTDGAGNSPNLTKGPWDVTVTGVDVNLRKGPGTNYSKVGTAKKGTKMTITETVDAGGYTWGNYGEGWIALRYTDFEQVVNGGTTSGGNTSGGNTSGGNTSGGNTTTTPTPQPEQVKLNGTINVNYSLNVRQNAGTNYPIVGELTSGQKVEITETKMVGATKWGHIAQGWISMDYVILDDDKTEPEKPDDTTDTETYTGTIVNCTVCVNVRSGPDVSYELVGTAKKGTKVTVSEIKGNWCKTDLGWISLTYVELDREPEKEEQEEQKPQPEPETPKTVWGTVEVNDFLRIRSNTSTNSPVVGYKKPNDRVEILEQTNAGGILWGRISEGWIALSYVKLDSDSQGSAPETTPKPEVTQAVWGTVNVNVSLNIRKEASVASQMVGTYGKNERVKILERKTVSGTVWGRTDRGWISMYYVIVDDYSGQINKSYTVIADRLNIRKGPSVDETIVSWVDYGAKVTVLEITTNDAGERWARLASGWVSMDYLK